MFSCNYLPHISLFTRLGRLLPSFNHHEHGKRTLAQRSLMEMPIQARPLDKLKRLPTIS